MAEKLIGKDFEPQDVRPKVMGTGKYTEDFSKDGMCYMKMLLCPMPSANVTNLDASEALAMPGVLGILTADEVPQVEEPSYPMLTMKPRQLGMPICAIAAESEAIAAEALEKIRVSYEPQPFVLDPLESLYPGGPNALESGNVTGGGEGNKPIHTRKWTARDFAEAGEDKLPMGEAPVEWAVGDVDAAFANAALVIDEPFVTASSSHAALEPRSVLSYWENGKCFIHGSSQSQSWMMPGLARMMQVPVDDIVYIAEYCGGGFGAKASPYPVQGMTAYMAKKLGRPVMLRVTRAEEYHLGGTRPGFQGQVKLAFDANGKMTAADLYIVQSGGPLRGSGDYSSAAGALALVYTPTNMRFRGAAVVTNKPWHVSQRGPGQNQLATVVEPLMDRAAKELGVDRVAIRDINAPGHDVKFSNRNSTVTSVYLKEAYKLGAERFNWDAKKAMSGQRNGNKVIGIGVGSAYHSAGSNGFDGLVSIRPDGKLYVHSGVGNLGTYSYAGTCRAASEVLGSSWENTVVLRGDSRHGLPWTLAQFGSNSTFTNTRTNYAAANKAKAMLQELAAMDLGGEPGDYDVADEKVFNTSDSSKSMTFAQAGQRAIELGGKWDGSEYPDNLHDVTKSAMKIVKGVGLVAAAKDEMPKEGSAAGMAACFCMIELDTDTGKYELLEMQNIADCGTVLHPQGLQQQLRGGAVMGIGEAVFDRMVYDPQNGLCATVGLYQTKPPSILDVPSTIETDAVNQPDPQNPFGVKGIGEPAMGSAAAALLSAISDATGTYFNRTPVDPDMIINALSGRAQSIKPLQVNV
ncbi:xanthine dehydrogenase family protein molybdopterin-binding subunit [Pseudemcibacter aquimaris]|uniref:xanthine dehydrogenase family protein molybdopterin-binding subunit n=1 Tax=Pseudemcibacter aquimaris TaxID=2857064 RepID=UPI002011CAC5|nr:xanthine dehydrogenase family protein [Pseudemcibacter aquimaris]MCC3860391.1 xanthine dehydrogenase family protein molybdopterin-binding subunit [Pseudemcibacter aquimaris]WDU57717.1 xanthine dehydrogenase family protein molybdopterin-binding subunit [Pseudemcibacter aquimaris]